MRFLPLAALGLMVIISGTVQGGEKDTNLLVGFWEVVKSDDTPAGSSVQFSKDGKLILLQKGKDKKIEATYKVEGKKITTTRIEDNKKEVNVVTIQTLNETTLTTVDDKGKLAELRRVKK